MSKNDKWFQSAKTWKQAQQKAAKMRKKGWRVKITKVYAGTPAEHYNLMAKPSLAEEKRLNEVEMMNRREWPLEKRRR